MVVSFVFKNSLHSYPSLKASGMSQLVAFSVRGVKIADSKLLLGTVIVRSPVEKNNYI